MNLKQNIKKFWAFLKEDSWPSFFVSLIVALIVIKFIFFPLLSLTTGTSLPLVIVESCSMYHSMDLDKIMANKIYSDYGLTINDTESWTLKNGFSKGDVIFVVGAKNVEIGDVIIFDGGRSNPIIHRVVGISEEDGKNIYETKGDNNLAQIVPGCNSGVCWTTNEKYISEDSVIGKAVFKIPAIGWIKLIFFDWRKPTEQRGLC
jgi:signal peptidase I